MTIFNVKEVAFGVFQWGFFFTPPAQHQMADNVSD